MKDRQAEAMVVGTGQSGDGVTFQQINGKASEDEVEIRQAASEVVASVIAKAKETVAEVTGKTPNDNKLFPPGALMLIAPPMIQIDLVGSRTPSPDEMEMDLSEQEDNSSKTITEPVSTEDTASLREFLVSYIQEIVSMAVPLAEEKCVTKIEQMEIEDFTTKLVTGPWYLRLRQAVSSFLQTICVCGERRNDTS